MIRRRTGVLPVPILLAAAWCCGPGLTVIDAAPAAVAPDYRALVERERGALAVLGDLRQGQALLAGRVEGLDRRVPAGSWVKLFLAYHLVSADLLQEGETLPCRGWQGDRHHCWYGPGHGLPDLRHALGWSCNDWFAAVLTRVDPASYRASLAAFFPSQRGRGRPPGEPSADWQGAFMRGELTPESQSLRVWCEAILSLVLGGEARLGEGRTSCPLRFEYRRLDRKARAAVLSGMRLAAREGTAAQLAVHFGSDDLLAKTSSSLSPRPRAGGRSRESLCLICGFYPAENPRAFIFLFVPRGFAAVTAAPLSGDILADFCRRRRIGP